MTCFSAGRLIAGQGRGWKLSSGRWGGTRAFTGGLSHPEETAGNNETITGKFRLMLPWQQRRRTLRMVISVSCRKPFPLSFPSWLRQTWLCCYGFVIFWYIFSCTNEDSLELVMSLSPNSIRDTLKIMKCFLFPWGGELGDWNSLLTVGYLGGSAPHCE